MPFNIAWILWILLPARTVFIGIIIGIDSENIYVAHSLWNSASKELTKREKNVNGVQITKYTHNEVGSIFPRVILMDDFYNEDGLLTNMW